MTASDDDTRVLAGPTRREVLKAGLAVAAGAILRTHNAGARTPVSTPAPRIRTRPLRREDLRTDPDLAG